MNLSPDFWTQVAAGVAARTYDKVTFTSNVTPPVTVSISEAITEPPGMLLGLIRPAVTLSGPAGELLHIAPRGEPRRGVGAVVLVGGLLLLVGVGVVIGRVTA